MSCKVVLVPPLGCAHDEPVEFGDNLDRRKTRFRLQARREIEHGFFHVGFRRQAAILLTAGRL